MSTLLVITGAELTPYSARGLTQTLKPIPASANMRRTMNGTLVDISDPIFRKYESVITCTDMDVPALDGVRPGMTVTVDCVAELSYRTSGGSPARTVAETTDDGATRVSGDFTFYRPRLTMKVTDWRTGEDEYGAEVNWQLSLEEV